MEMDQGVEAMEIQVKASNEPRLLGHGSRSGKRTSLPRIGHFKWATASQPWKLPPNSCPGPPGDPASSEPRLFNHRNVQIVHIGRITLPDASNEPRLLSHGDEGVHQPDVRRFVQASNEPRLLSHGNWSFQCLPNVAAVASSEPRLLQYGNGHRRDDQVYGYPT